MTTPLVVKLRFLSLKNLAGLLAKKDDTAPKGLQLYCQALWMEDDSAILWQQMGTLVSAQGRAFLLRLDMEDLICVCLRASIHTMNGTLASAVNLLFAPLMLSEHYVHADNSALPNAIVHQPQQCRPACMWSQLHDSTSAAI